MWRTIWNPIVVLAFLLAGSSTAQEITITAVLQPPSFAVGQQARLELRLENAQGNITPPDLGGLVLLQGPMDRSSVQVINGRMTSSLIRTYVVTATKPGTYTIGPAVARVAGGSIKSEPITVTVAKGDAPVAGGDLDRLQAKSRDLFVTITVDRRKVFVGEQIVATYTLYNRYRSLETSKYELPTLNGFWAEAVDLGKTNWEPAMQHINGLPYRVAILKKQVLLPQRSGTLRIDPMKLTCMVDRDFFSRGREVQITSNAVDITVDELPPGAPAGSSGAVGEFEVKVSVDRSQVKPNEAIEFILRISGRGNLRLLDAPRIGFPADFEVYDPKVKDRIGVSASGMSGSREFQYLVIPRRPGSFQLPPLEFAHFDPKARSYRKADARMPLIEVEKGDPASEGAAIPRTSRTDVEVLAEDIRFIRTGELALRTRSHFLFGSTMHVLGIGAPALAFLLLLGWRWQRGREQADMPAFRRRKADAMAGKRLTEARKAMAKGDRIAFHGALAKALEGYCADKFDVGIAEVSADRLVELLPETDEGRKAAETYGHIIERCGMARFAPVEEKPSAELYEQAAELIRQLENLTRPS
jgi:hypothetical protein